MPDNNIPREVVEFMAVGAKQFADHDAALADRGEEIGKIEARLRRLEVAPTKNKIKEGTPGAIGAAIVAALYALIDYLKS